MSHVAGAVQMSAAPVQYRVGSLPALESEPMHGPAVEPSAHTTTVAPAGSSASSKGTSAGWSPGSVSKVTSHTGAAPVTVTSPMSSSCSSASSTSPVCAS